MNSKKTECEIPLGHTRIQKHGTVGIRCEIRPAEIILRRVPDVRIPSPKNWLFLFDDVFSGFVLARHGEIIIGIADGILRSWDFNQRRSVSCRGNFDDGVDTLGVNHDRCAYKYCEQEAAFESIRRHCDAFIFKGGSQGGRRSNQLAKAGQALILLTSYRTKPY